MTLVWVAVATLLGFTALVAVILLWARKRVITEKGREDQKANRQLYLTLATHAAADASGVALVKLLNALETAPPDCPVAVQWVRRLAPDNELGMLVRISWDGNEWRRILPWQPLREQVRAATIDDPTCGPRVRALLAELEATP